MISKAELNKSPFLQLILLLCLCLISLVIFSVIGGLLAATVYGFNPTEINNLGDPKMIKGMKLLQLFSALGLFIVPPLVYGLFTAKNPIENLGLSKVNAPFNYLLVLVLMVVLTPFLSWVIELNANMIFPEFLSGIEAWMRSSESKAELLTKAFLTFDGIGSLILVMVIVAIVPAIGEELLFRGVLQKLMIRWTKNPHVGIWIAAFLFSALHLQFFGFFPRLLLGALFGYLFLWTNSLWVPILGHFINNGTVVMASYFYPELINDADFTLFGAENANWITTFFSLFLATALLFLIWKLNRKNKTNKPHYGLDRESQSSKM
jgi:membrane protease YdiL (CAAX protease family)